MAIILGILAGIGLPIQTGINTTLRKKVGSPYRASLVSFIVALVFLVLLLIVTGEGVAIPFGRILKEPLWIWIGGICGVIFLTGNILLISKIGSVQTVVLPVLGQILMGLIVDNFGLFYAEQVKTTALRIFGALFVIGGVLIVSMTKDIKYGSFMLRNSKVEGTESVSVKAECTPKLRIKEQSLWIWRIFGIFTGMLSAVQTAVNGYLGKVAGSSVKASAVSFMVGAILLSIVCIVTAKKDYIEKSEQVNGKYPLWIWTGGILGGLYLLANITLSSRLGTGMTIILLLIGSTVGGLFIDQFGLFGVDKKPLHVTKAVGVLVMIVGAAAIKIY